MPPRNRTRPRITAAARPARRRIEGLPVASVQIAAAAAAGGERRRFKMVAYTGEMLDLCGFELPVVIDVATLDLSAQSLPALLDHMAWESSIVGQIDSVRVEGANGQVPPIVAEGYFTPTTNERDAGAFVLAKADAGFIWQASVGGDPKTLDRIEAGQTVAVNGRTYAGPCFVARGVVLREISFVVLGADRRTSAVLARRRIKGAVMDFATWVASLGFTEADLTDQQRAALQIQFNTLYPPADESGEVPTPTNAEGETTTPPDEETPAAAAEGETATPEDEEPAPTNAAARRPALNAGANRRPDAVADENRRIAANRRRIARIDQICAGAGNPEITVNDSRNRSRRVNLQAHAIEQGWSTERVELEALRASRGTGPAVASRDHSRDCTADALACAAILRAGGRLDHPAYQTQQAVAMRIPAFLRQNINAEARQRAMEAGHRYAGLHAMDFAKEALRLDRREVPHDRTDMIRAAFSGGSLTNVFTTNINAVLLATYLEATDTTAGWVREQEVNDYRLNERPRKNIGKQLSKLPRGGTADHRNRSDTGESYKLARFAGQTVIDEMDFIDDNLGALQDEPVDMGNACARLRPDLVYAVLLRNDSLAGTGRALFNTTDGNRLTGAALAGATLRAAVKTFMLLRENGVNLNLKPTHLVVPPSLIHLAYELVNSTEILIAGTAGSVTERGNVNSLRMENLTPVADSRLDSRARYRVGCEVAA